jgi:hypothetical protein
MGNVSSDKTTDGTTPVSESTSESGQSGMSSSGKSSTNLPAASFDQPSRPNVRHPGFTEPRYGTSPLNMGNMSYALPGHPQQYDQMQYPAHGQGMMYMPMPYGPNTGVPYGVPYPYPPYSIQHPPGHASHYQPYANQPMQNIPGQSSPYASGYYPYGTYVHPTGPMHQNGSPVGRAQTNSPPKPASLRKEAERQIAQLEYDVSKTIVDGSNPMKLVLPQPLLSGECFQSLTQRLSLIRTFSQTVAPLHTPTRSHRVPHEDHHESQSNPAMRSGWVISHPGPM